MPESLGKTLQRIRKSKNLSVEEVSGKTHIPKKIVVSIEEDKLNEFSSIFYARSFVKTYSRFLGALEEKAVKDFLSGKLEKDTPELVLKREESIGSLFIKHKERIATVALAIFIVWAAFLSIIHVGRFTRNLFTRCKVSKTVPTELQTEPKPNSAAIAKTESSAKKVETIKTEKAGLIELEITARYNTWVLATSDKKVLFRGILKKEKSDTWRTDKEITLELGNAGGVHLNLNGKNLGYPGKKGEKKEIVITADGIK
ncbi:helix-turn-helix domain-containing protein [Candidatus Omnitrophota bacterium]